jgi:hypothetical protein
MAPQLFATRVLAVLGFAAALLGAAAPAWAQGNITGTVRNAANTNPVQFVTVQLVSTSTGQQVNSAQTNVNGVFTMNSIVAGTYFVRTSNSQGFIDQIVSAANAAGQSPSGSNRGNCVGCIATSNNVVTSSSPGVGQVHGAAAQVYDFNLSQGGKISGTITKAAPLNGVNVQIFTSAGVQVSGSAQTDNAGLYGAGLNPGPGLTPGNYYIKTSSVPGHVDAVYNTSSSGNAALCLGCTVTSTGQQVTVVGTGTTSNISMTLAAGGTLAGAVTGGGNPLNNGSVIVYNSSTGAQLTTLPLNSGNYTTSLPAGTYKVATSNSAGFINQLHSGISLTGFTQQSFIAANGTAVTVNVSATTTVNFSLIAGATISGTVTNANGGATINGISVALFNSSNSFVTSQSTSGGGAFSFTGLAAGDYYLKTQNSNSVGTGFIDRAYNSGGSVTCGQSCNVTTVGTVTTVAAGQTASARNISLLPGGRILGRVTIAGTSTGIQGVNVQAFDASSSFGGSLGQGTTNASGDYVIQGLAALTYTVKTSNSLGYLEKLYNDIPCNNCTTTAGQNLPVNGNDTNNINFALVQGGTITGTITNASNASGVQNVNVGFYNANGVSVGSTNTNAQGVYISSGLPNGSYFVVTTNNQSGLINKLYTSGGGINCLSCQNNASTVVSGTPVPVTVGNQTTSINLALTPGLTIGGSVRRGDTNALVPSFSVSLYTASSGTQSIGGQSTGSGGQAGLFTLPAVPPGTYFVKSNGQSSSGLINQVWKPGNGVTGITCGGSCNPSELGTAIVLTSTSVTNIDFVLAPGGSITGQVTSTTSGLPISGVSVQVYDVNNPNSQLSSIATDGSGNYTLGGLATGSYYVRAQGTGNFIGEVYNNVTCSNCNLSSAGGTAIPVTAGSVATGINFSLASGGTITGTVVNSNGNTPLQGISVQLSTATNNNAGSIQTNASGVFTIAGLPAGTYYAKTTNSQGFIDKIFDNIVCQTCFSSSANGTPIVLAVGETKQANFSLTLGRRVSGRVTDSATNAPISGISVGLFNNAGQQLTSATTNDAGNYTTQTGVPDGTYFAKTFTSGNTSSGYINKLYNNIACVNCLAASGNPINIAGTNVTGIDFALSAGGRVTGTITDSSNNPVAGVSVSLYSSQTDPLTKGQIFLGSGVSGPTGTYAVNGLPAGTAVAKTSNGLGYIDEIFNNIKCANCSVTTGQTFNVATGQTTPGIDFSLDSGARITGTVKNSSNVPLQGVSVGIYTATSPNTAITTASTNQLGVYTTGGLPPGTYYARTTFASGYVNQLYNGLICAPCTPANGTAITLTGTDVATGIDFTLSAGASIAGSVLEAGSSDQGDGTSAVGDPITTARVSIYDSGNAFISSVNVQPDGTYRVTGLAPGTYFAKTSNTQGFIDKMYNGVNCVFCSLTGGTPIVVPATGEVGSINFALARGGGISGTVRDDSNNPLANISVSIFGAGGQFLRSSTTDGLGNFVLAGLADGTYYLRTQNSLGYIDKLYNDITCSTCNPLTGTGVKVLGANSVAGISFVLPVGGFIAGTITNGTGTPIENVSVSVFSAAGGPPVASGFTNANGVYKTGGVPTGSYFVKTNNSKGFIDQLYQGKNCSVCNPTTGTPVGVTVGQGTSGIDFALTPGGRISGTITSSENSQPLPGVNVSFFNASGQQVGNAQTDGTGKFLTFGGLPTGTYYAKTNNSQGLVDKIYNNILCAACSAATGTPISVTVGAETTGVDFALAAGARIGGTITDSSSGAPVANARVDVFASNGFFVTSAQTGSNGKYVTNAGMGAGTYYARANTAQGHIAKMYNNVDCPVCSPLKGTPIVLTASQSVSNIDFALAAGGLISGTVKDQVTGAPIGAGEGLFVNVQIFNANNNLVATAGVDPAGRYTSGTGMPSGTYYARTINNQGYINKLYGNSICLGESKPGGAGGGLGAPACVPTSGTPIPVTVGQTTQNIDFTLAIGLRIGGKVTDAATGLPLASAGVGIFDSQGRQVTGGRADNAGNYQSDGGLPPGTYFAIGNAFDQGYVPQLYNGVGCLGCNPTLGTPINATSSQIGINFALTTGGSFTGSVKATSSGLGQPNVKLSLYNAAGSLLGSGRTDGSGNFSASGIPPGTYFLRTFNLLGLIDESHLNHACAPCVITDATPITITAGATVSGLDFVLDQGGLVSGTITNGANGAPLQGATVSFYTQGGAFVGRSEPSDENGYYAISLPVGTYVVQPDPVQGYTPVANDSSRARNAGLVVVSSGGESTVEVPLEVCTPPTIAPTALDLLSIGTAYSKTLTATGPNGPYTFSIADGTLPPGLSLSSAGVLTGTPTTRGTANFTIAATGSNSCSGTNVYAQTTRGVSLSSLEAAFSADGGTGTVGITAETSEVAWAAISNAGWITITGAASGTGSGSISYAVAANTGAVRTGLITIAGEAFLVTQAQPSRPRISLDTPRTGDVLGRSFQVAGWAIDLDASSGVGTDSVRVYASTLANGVAGTPVLLGEAVRFARADLASVFGSQFVNSGYYLGVEGLAAGSYRILVEARSTVTGRYDAQQSADVTVTAPGATPYSALDSPAPDATVGASFNVEGWAVDVGATSGTGVDAVHIWAFPINGNTLGTGVFLGEATLGGARPDVGAILGSQFTNSGFSGVGSGLPAGRWRIAAYPHSSVSGTFSAPRFSDVTVDVPIPRPLMAVDGPQPGATVTAPFVVVGWAADTGALSGTGVDQVVVWAFNTETGAGTYLGAAAYGGSRPDVGNIFGAAFTNSGFSLSVPDLAAGSYDLVIFARSTVAGTFNQSKIVRITVP